MFAYTISSNVASLFIDGKLHTVKKENPVNWAKLLTAIKENDVPTILNLVSKKTAVTTFLQNSPIYIDGNQIKRMVNPPHVYPDDEVLHSSLVTRILQMVDEGFDVTPMVKFLDNLLQNPSNRAIQELYNFLEVCNLPITDDGRFIAYKRIRYDYMDVYSGTIDNNVGQTVTMDRRNVNDDCRQTCSYGLHVCSLGYLSSYSGERLMVVLVNPRDVVSIPIDYKNSKMRVCQYTVHSEISLETIKEYNASLPAVFGTSHSPECPMIDEQENEDEDEDEYENEDEESTNKFKHNELDYYPDVE